MAARYPLVNIDGTISELPTSDSLAGYQQTLVSGTSIKTLNGSTLLGSGNISVSGSGDIVNGGQIGAVSIGTTDANDTVLLRNGADKVRVTSAGTITIGNSGIVDPATPYTLSVQTNALESWLEILNSGGAGKGAFFGMSGDDFQLWNSQDGGTVFYSGSNASFWTILSLNADKTISLGENGKTTLDFSAISTPYVINYPDKASTQTVAFISDVPTLSSLGAAPLDAFCCTNATLTLSNVATLQKCFNSSTNGALTVTANKTYEFECLLNLSAMSATSGNMGFSILGAGTATMTSAGWQAVGLDATTLTTAAAMGGIYSASAGATGNITTAGTGTAMSVLIKGIFRVNAGGTIIPSVQLTTASAAVVGVNSYFKAVVKGAGSSAIANGAWS